jgi:acyl-coenzyme A thioesterase PaaI-like protein
LPSYEKCFFCGRDSKGLKLKVGYAEGVCSCDFVVDDAFQGFHGVLHGGIVSGILDEIMWWAVFMEMGAICFTRKMDVEFRKTIFCGKAHRAIGKYGGIAHGSYHVSGSIEDGSGKVCANANAVFREAKGVKKDEFLQSLDFSGESGEVESILRSRLLGTGGE